MSADHACLRCNDARTTQVLDSPLARLKDLMVQLCEEQKLLLCHAIAAPLEQQYLIGPCNECIYFVPRRCWTAHLRA